MNRRLPFFLTMARCPRRCVYCDQAEITGVDIPPSPEEVARTLAALDGPREICYFGGSFTCLPATLQEKYLSAVLNAPSGSTVRFSTHPECITEQVLDDLRPYPVSMVELGISSLDDGVLTACNRGYTGRFAVEAMELVLSRGYSLCAQMMIGLPCQTEESSLEDLRRLDAMRGESPMTLRIYPCLVLEDTPLARLFLSGQFTPLSVRQGAAWSGRLLREAKRLGFAVQRIGLHETESLSRSVLSGPHHPALGELARSEALVLDLVEESPAGPWHVEEKIRSQLFGHGGYGLLRLAERSGLTREEARGRVILTSLSGNTPSLS